MCAQCEMQQLQQTNEQKKVTAIKKRKISMSQYDLQNKVTKKVVPSFYLFGEKKILKNRKSLDRKQGNQKTKNRNFHQTKLLYRQEQHKKAMMQSCSTRIKIKI